MRVCVHGLGTVGLPMALLLAADHEVVGVDTDEALIERLAEGELPPDKPELESIRADAEAIHPTTAPEPADFHLIAAPTPLDPETNVADLRAVGEAVEAAASHLRPDDTVVVLSTVPPGTTDRLVAPLVRTTEPDAAVAFCPERAMLGDIVAEMRTNDRLVGCREAAASDRIVALFETFVTGDIHRTDPRTAEFVKLAENTYRDVNIALANELALLAEDAGVDVHEMRGFANRHPRVDLLEPGPGVGGHCVTVDPWFLVDSATTARLIPAAREVNDTMPDRILHAVRAAVEGPGSRVAVLGAAYKGDVADTRRTPARRLVRRLENDGYEVAVHDPHVESFTPDPVTLDSATADANCLVLVTDHSAYASLEPERLAEQVADARLVDTQNALDHDAWRAAGFTVSVLGDGTHGSGRE